VGKLNVRGAKKEGLQSLFDVDETPLLKFVMVQHKEDNLDSASENENLDMDDDPGIYSLEYIGKQATAEDIFDSIMHYWYRLIVSEYTELSAIRKLLETPTEDTHEFVDLIPARPLFSMSSMDELETFVHDHGSYLFSASPQELLGVSEREDRYIRDLMGDNVNESHLAFVQCRTYEDYTPTNRTLSSFEEFDKVALLYLYRKDVAFFVIVSEDCGWIQEERNDSDIDSNGIIRAFSVETLLWVPGAVFNPSSRGTFQPASTNETMTLNMTHFVIVQSTPSVMWLDRYTTATIAFPTYREKHCVLFIDVHSPRRQDGSFDYNSKAYLQSRHAISLLRQTYEKHRETRPFEDVVFMVVPSSAIQIMTTFGMDIWSEMDRECSDRVSDGECFVEDIPSLPAAMITSRRESSSFMNVYHLPSTDLIGSNNNLVSGGPLFEFLNSSFIEGTLSPTIKSEQLSENENRTLSSGVQIVTADTFQQTVLDEDNSESKHSVVYFYTPTCGHCKRFDTTWHNLARLIRKMNWNTKIDVMKMDISKNDLHLDQVNIRYLPAVYFFSTGRKDSPQEMVLESDLEVGGGVSNLGGVSDPMVVVRWMLNMLAGEELRDLKHLATMVESE